jgi:hypothetical protein
MNIALLILLLIPLSFAGSPPACDELGTILEDMEKDLQKKFTSNCGTLKAADLVADVPVADPTFLEGKLCSDLTTIETQLENLKLQEAVLTGINKLKVTIDESKEATESNKGEAQREAGMTFVDSLNTAQSLEVLLQSVTEDGDPLIQKLKELPENKRLNQRDLSDRVAEFCKNMKKDEQNACNPNLFKPGPEAATELLDLIKNADPTTEQISKWQGMLAIKRINPPQEDTEEDTEYSFTQMQAELTDAFGRIDQKEVMSKAHIQAIQKLDDFENAPGLSFVEDIASLKDKKKAKIASDKFFLLMGDARLRQQYEVQSKLSVMWQEVKNQIPDLSESQKQQCDTAKTLYDDAKACLASLENARSKLTGDTKANLYRFLPALRVSVDYADNLMNQEAVCEKEIQSQQAVTEACYADFNKDLADVQDQILQLNILKDRIGSENMDLMKFRNFALMKWGSQKCDALSTPMDFCEEPTQLSKEAFMTFSDVMKIAVVFAPKPEAEEEAEELCDDEDNQLTKKQRRLCEFFNDTTSNIIVTENKEDISAPTEAPDGGHAKRALRSAWIQGGANVLNQALGFMMPMNNPQFQNYYPFNYAPHNDGARPMGIADGIMFNARYNGAYGFYMPTLGYEPFTAFGGGNSMTPYSPVSASAGKFFNFQI